MILSMPSDMIYAVHRLASASKQAGDITFTDKDGNIITDNNEDTEEETMEDEPIPIPTTNIENDQAITGVGENMYQKKTKQKKTAIQDLNQVIIQSTIRQEEITGVTEEDNTNMVPIPEEEKDPDKYVTLEDINIMSEMYTSNRLVGEREGEESSEMTG